MDFAEGLSFQQRRILNEQALDLALWGGPQLSDFLPQDFHPSSKPQASAVFRDIMARIDRIRYSPTDYSDFEPSGAVQRKMEIVPDFKAPQTIMGKCPCPDDSRFLRCCNLKTLDAVQQCAFACSYCSIRNFYSQTRIQVVSDLDLKLSEINLDSEVWHIGTGQSSDSLFLGDDYGTITALANFARRHPQVIVELKTKSARTDWIKASIPRNVISTWSLNARTITQKEEHLTATSEDRIDAAARYIESGHLAGFHIHPMVYFKGWEDEYAALVKYLTDRISPESTVMVGIGTLTFTKPALRKIRENGRPTRITCMPLVPIAGKFSYPFEIKKQLFSHLYNCFPSTWKERVFFYLCMEDPALWQPCLGRSYLSNKEFEEDMRRHYLGRVLG